MKQNYYQGQTFRNESIELSGNRFHGCTFEKCKLIYRGDISPTFKDNHFVDSVFEFADAAMRTIYFLSGMYHAGNGGREIVVEPFGRILQKTIQGSVNSTINPQPRLHTFDCVVPHAVAAQGMAIFERNRAGKNVRAEFAGLARSARRRRRGEAAV